jgi:subtilisin family serine protease
LKLTDSPRLTETWFKYLAPFQDEVAKLRTDDVRIRIAMLDTGMDEKHDAFQKTRQQGLILSGKGFPDNLLPFEDKHGHGTHAASVLLRTAPTAELFIARIFDDQGQIDPKNDYDAVVQVCSFSFIY